MLTTGLADADNVIRGALGLCRYICCGLVIASFALFTADQLGGASRHQVAEITAGSPTRSASRTAADSHPGQPRRFIDGASRALTTPFRSVISSGSQWVQRGFALICALLLYGLGLGYLLRYSQGST
jgi:hypothetical protein